MTKKKTAKRKLYWGMAVYFDLFFQCQVTGVSGQSGLLAPGPVGQSLCPATGAVAVLNPRPEEQHALENRKYTMELAFKSREIPVLLLPSVQVRRHQQHLSRRFIILQRFQVESECTDQF